MNSPPGTLQVLYRGSLESCNYGCSYCPFAKRRERPAAVRADREELQRFVAWVGHPERVAPRVDRFEVLFTPWGEALHRARYQNAIRQLAEMPHVSFVGIQTNLSVAPRWVEPIPEELRSKVSLWATWHPSETSLASFVSRVRASLALGIGVSPGVVATHEHLDLLGPLHNELVGAGSSLQWINAFKRGYRTPKGYYSDAEVDMLTQLDPWFGADLAGERSIKRTCATGTDGVAIDGDGNVTRCHFVKRKLGNIYTDPIDAILNPLGEYERCSRTECNCFQGYVHLLDTKLHAVFGGAGALARTYVSNIG